MYKNKLAFLFCLVTIMTVAIGCGGGSSDMVSIGNSVTSNIIKETPKKVEEGKPLEISTSGIKINAEANTFKKGVEISIVENKFSGTRSSYLSNAPKTYGVYGKMVESNGILTKSTPIDYVDEAVSIEFDNSFNSNEVESLFLAKRDNEEADWEFIRLNEILSNSRIDVNMTRAATSGKLIVKTNRLNLEFCLFAKLRGSNKLVPAVEVDAVNTMIEAANDDNAKKGKLPVKDDVYTDDMKVTLEVGGKNVNSLNLSDYIVEVSYVNNDNTINKKIAGSGSIYSEPKYNPGLGSGNKWAHSIIINDLKGSADKVSFTMNTKGMKIDEFPQNFNVNIKNNNNVKDTLPFGYSENVKVENQEYEPKAPMAPIEIVASAKRIKAGDFITVTWKQPESEEGKEPEVLTYSVSLAKGGAEDTVVAEGLIDTEWKSEPLEIGSYSIKVASVNKDGLKTEGEPLNIDVVDPSLPVITLNPMLKNVYKTGETFEVSWADVIDPLDKPVSYKVVLKANGSEEPTEIEVTGTSWSSDTLAADEYTLKVVASNGETSIESEPVSFSVKAGIPTAPVLNAMAQNAYKLGEQVSLIWEPSTDPFNKPITYDLYLYTGEIAETPVATGLTDTTWTSASLATGTYNIKLVATNGTESNETVVPNAFTVWTTSRATICDAEGSAYATGVYCVRPEFFVEISEKNFDENEIANAVAVDGVTATNVKKEWVSDTKLKISFNSDLTLGQPCIISFGSVKDKYDATITPFETKNFNIIPFPGSGTDADPFVPGYAEAIYLTADSKLALISGLNTEVGVFKDMMFGNGIIKADGAVKWSNLEIANVNDNPVVEIPETDMWEANKTNMNVTLNFDGTIEGKTYKFATNSKNYTTESGLAITIGDGSEPKPYFVYTPNQLIDDVRNYTNGQKFFKQVRDIDLAGFTSTNYDAAGNGLLNTICNYSNNLNGVYDGNNKIINNLKIVSTATCMGLFGTVGTTGSDTTWGEIKNLGLTNVDVSAGGTSGALVGECARGIITNCYAIGVVKSNGPVGGLIGRVYGYGKIRDCYFQGDVYTPGTYSQSGGITGTLYGSDANECIMENCYVTESTIHGGCYTGGLVGQVNTVSLVKNCYVENTHVTGLEYNNGGLIGNIQGAKSITGCYVKNCEIEGPSYTGGVIGDIGYTSSGDKITDCYGIGLKVKATGQYAGGFMGYDQTSMLIDKCYAEVESVEGSQNVGGFIGNKSSGNVTNCHVIVSGNVTGGQYVGGFVGQFSGSLIENCYSEAGDIVPPSGTGASYCGGFGGGVWGIVNKCHSKAGNIVGAQYVGGLIGYCSATLSNSYAESGAVTSVALSIGGLVGENNYTTVNCYTNCTVDYTGSVPEPKIGLIFGNMCNSDCGSCFTTQTTSSTWPSIDLVGYGSPVTNCHSLPDGYDSTKLDWDDTIWDLSKALPTLK